VPIGQVGSQITAVCQASVWYVVKSSRERSQTAHDVLYFHRIPASMACTCRYL